MKFIKGVTLHRERLSVIAGTSRGKVGLQWPAAERSEGGEVKGEIQKRRECSQGPTATRIS